MVSCDAVPGGARARRVRPSRVVMVQIVPAASPRAEEKKSCPLPFTLAGGAALHYKIFNQIDQNYGGTDVSMNQTSQVDMAYGEKSDSTGAARVDLKYLEGQVEPRHRAGSSRIGRPRSSSREPTIRVIVIPNGQGRRVRSGPRHPGPARTSTICATSSTPGSSSFPDTTIAVGESWTEEIEEGKNGREEPRASKGTAVYTLKKIEKKGDLEVAVDRGQGEPQDELRTRPAGMLVGGREGRSEGADRPARGATSSSSRRRSISGETSSRRIP